MCEVHSPFSTIDILRFKKGYLSRIEELNLEFLFSKTGSRGNLLIK